MSLRIAILGDFNFDYPTHRALNESVYHVNRVLNREIQFDWVATDAFNYEAAFKNDYCGLWIAPGSPYKGTQNVLNAITFARQNNIPTFGNCGGFQHMVIEFARNVGGISDADFEELNPTANNLIISKLVCPMVMEEEHLTIADKQSILYGIMKSDGFTGKYYCHYGLNNEYIKLLQSRGLRTTALSDDGQVRAIEIPNHRFFLGTLFQPALTSSTSELHPLIVEFVRQAINWKVIYL